MAVLGVRRDYAPWILSKPHSWALIDDEKARVIETRSEGEMQYWLVQTIAGDRFEDARPPLSEAIERELLERIRVLVGDEENPHG